MTYSDITKTLMCWFIVDLSELLNLFFSNRQSKVCSAHLSFFVELLGDRVAEGVTGLQFVEASLGVKNQF